MPRKKPFGGKQKKQQLQLKRLKKRETGPHYGDRTTLKVSDTDSSADSDDEASHLSNQGAAASEVSTSKRSGRGREGNQRAEGKDRYKLCFQEMTREEITAKKEESMQPYVQKSMEQMECSTEEFYDPPIMFPTRPPWNPAMTPSALEQQEHRYFQSYCEKFLNEHAVVGFVELNLETWRQLWRVLEMSDVLLHIIDVRYSPLHFNPALYYYITDTLHKKVIVVLNKCDIVPPQVAIAWKQYLLSEFPELEVVIFTSFPKDESTREQLSKGKQSKRRRKKTCAVGPLELWSVCNKLVSNDLNIDSWKAKIQDDMKVGTDDITESDQSDVEVEGEHDTRAKPELGYVKHQKYRDGVLTIGCVGYPNVGKSAVINGLMGRKVVSVSRTPGHTKHFQTIFLTNNVRLCDCPGLVFPSTAPRAIQVLAGMYPIAQLREPYSVVQYLAERCDLPASLHLKLSEDEDAWSAYMICDELAELKGFKTARGARTDPYRAANWILRSALEGKLLLYLLPPLYSSRLNYWLEHEEATWLLNIQLERLEQTRQNSQVKVKEDSDQSEDSASSFDEAAPLASTNAFALLGEDD